MCSSDLGEGSYHFISQTSEPDCCQLKMMFIDGALYFGAVDHVQRHMREVDAAHPAQKHLLLLAPGINFIDSSGAELLAQESRRRRLLAAGCTSTACSRRPSRCWTGPATCRRLGRKICCLLAKT